MLRLVRKHSRAIEEARAYTPGMHLGANGRMALGRRSAAPFRCRRPARIASLIALGILAPFLAIRCVAVDTAHTTCWLHRGAAHAPATAAHAHTHGHQRQHEHGVAAHAAAPVPASGHHHGGERDETCCERSGKTDLRPPTPPSLDMIVVLAFSTVAHAPVTRATRWKRDPVEPTAHAPPLFLRIHTLII